MPDREKVINKVTAIVADMQEEVDEWKDYSDSELRNGLTCDCDWWYKTLQTLKDALALLKAQEPRTETQGRWERVGTDGIVCCSVCGMPMNKTRVCFPNGDSGYYYIATKYCHHCGAKNEKGDCDG